MPSEKEIIDTVNQLSEGEFVHAGSPKLHQFKNGEETWFSITDEEIERSPQTLELLLLERINAARNDEKESENGR